MRIRILLLYLAFMCVCLCSNAQNNSLEINCQEPGWLSSYIRPDVGKTITGLTVKGTINEDDLKTIGNLMKNYNLNERLDLTDARIVGQKNDYFSGDMLGVSDCSLSYLALPSSLTDMEKGLSWGVADTVVVGGDSIKSIYLLPHLGNCIIDGSYKSYRYEYITTKHIIIREGTEKLSTGDGNTLTIASSKNQSVESISLPESIKYISSLSAFKNLSSINTPSNVEYLNSLYQTKVHFNEETYYVPSKVKIFSCDWVNDGYWGEGGTTKALYLPSHLEEFNLGNLMGNKAAITIHSKSVTAPKTYNGSSTALRYCVVYVPEGSEEIYRRANIWKNATVLGEVYAKDISIKPTRLYLGDKTTLHSEVTPINTTFKNIIWESGDTTVINIDKEGNALGLTYGSTPVTAYSSDKGCSKTINIHVYAHTTGITISNKQIEMQLGEKRTIHAQTLPLDMSDGRIKWETDNPSIATVDSVGNITPHGKGVCNITAITKDGGYKDTCAITVKQPVESLSLNMHQINLKCGEDCTLIADVKPVDADDKAITWISKNEELATVKEGVVSALKAGRVIIIAVSNDDSNVSDSCEILITQPVSGIAMSKSNCTLIGIGSTVQLEAYINPDDATNKNVSWISSDERVGIVSNGLVVAVGYGTCVIVARTEDGAFMATCVIQVEAPTGIGAIEGSHPERYKIYTIDGKPTSIRTKGIKIIKYENGTSKTICIE